MARRFGPAFPLGVRRSGGLANWLVLCIILGLLLGRAVSSAGDGQGSGRSGSGRRDLQFGRGLNSLRGLKEGEELAGAGEVGREAAAPSGGSPIDPSESDKNPAAAAAANATMEAGAAAQGNGTVAANATVAGSQDKAPAAGSPTNATQDGGAGPANQTATLGGGGKDDEAALGPVTVMSSEEAEEAALEAPGNGDKPTDPKAADPKAADSKAADSKDAEAPAGAATNATATEAAATGAAGAGQDKDSKEEDKDKQPPTPTAAADGTGAVNGTAAVVNGTANATAVAGGAAAAEAGTGKEDGKGKEKGEKGNKDGKEKGDKEGKGEKEGEATKPGEKPGDKPDPKDPQLPAEAKGEGSKGGEKKDGKGAEEEDEDGPPKGALNDDLEPDTQETGGGPKKDDKTSPIADAETKAVSCDPSVKCHGHGSCDAKGQCVCHPPWSGPTCLHNDCADVEDCLLCATKMRRDDASLSLGCYWSDGECRGDGAQSPDVDVCSAGGWFGGAWAYLQYVFLALLVLGGGGLLYLRAARNGGLGSQFQRIPIGSSGHGGSAREEWGWDPEEDNVELLHGAGPTSTSTSMAPSDGRPEPYSDRPKETGSARGNGIYSLVRANPLGSQQSKDPLSGSHGNGTPAPSAGVGDGHSRGPSASNPPPSDVDLFAELGMEANPRFKTGAPRAGESPPSSQRNRGSTGRLGAELLGSGSAGAAWDGDDDIDI